ncbi:MAG TPA: amino acid racemase [Candidatus Peribacteraceae bacterium]|nr:amino acid racemase [Candidatus Peribacteraceae bacterium]
MPSSPQTIGVLGGMGHSAAADLFQKMLAYAQTEYRAVQDEEYPPIIIHSLPLAGFDETGVADEEIVRKQLVERVKGLEAAGADLIAIACNTVHIYHAEMQAAVHIPIINMVEVTMHAVQLSALPTIGLFCSETTTKTHLYQKTHKPDGLEIIEPTPEQQAHLNHVIEHVMGGTQNEDDVAVLQKIAAEYQANGAQGVILGCTEIPLAIKPDQLTVPVFDATKILAKVAVDMAIGRISSRPSHTAEPGNRG